MRTNVQNDNQHNNLIKYYPNYGAQIRLDNILTPNHIVRPEMLLIKVEGRHVDVIKLLGVRNTSEMVYLLIEDQRTGRVHEISHVLDPDNGYFVWFVVSYEYVVSALEDSVFDRLKNNGELLEFDF